MEATRLLFLDMHPGGEFALQSRAMSEYQDVGNTAVKRQLGAPRVKSLQSTNIDLRS